VKRRGDGSDLHVESFGNGAVVEVEVVPEEERVALPLWKLPNRLAITDPESSEAVIESAVASSVSDSSETAPLFPIHWPSGSEQSATVAGLVGGCL
jgi:hypothetical protein